MKLSIHCKAALLFATFINLNLGATNELDNLGLKYGTDKSSIGHNYTKVYEKYFATLKDKPIRFLEIGFLTGSSAHMWEDYFCNAQLFFIDIDPTATLYFKNFKRTQLAMVNQEDPISLHSFIYKYGGNFDIIIDDGGHTMNQQITSFKVLFPHLKSGGIYIIEDLHTSYAEYIPDYIHYGSKNPGQQTAVEFLQNLVHSVNKVGARTACADYNKCPHAIASELTPYEKEIESIHFYCSLCFIFKK